MPSRTRPPVVQDAIVEHLRGQIIDGALAPGDAGPPPLWLEGRSLELGTPTGYAPWIDMLREYLAWRPGVEDRQRRERLVYALRRLVEPERLGGRHGIPGARVLVVAGVEGV